PAPLRVGLSNQSRTDGHVQGRQYPATRSVAPTCAWLHVPLVPAEDPLWQECSPRDSQALRLKLSGKNRPIRSPLHRSEAKFSTGSQAGFVQADHRKRIHIPSPNRLALPPPTMLSLVYSRDWRAQPWPVERLQPAQARPGPKNSVTRHRRKPSRPAQGL